MLDSFKDGTIVQYNETRVREAHDDSYLDPGLGLV